MKNKIRCLFEKINKFFGSEHFIDDVLRLITVAVVIFSTVFCMLLSSFSASAYDTSIFPYSFSISNPSNIPFSELSVHFFNNTWHTEYGLGNYTSTRPVGSDIAYLTVTVENGSISSDIMGTADIVLENSIADGVYYVVFYCGVGGTDTAITVVNDNDFNTALAAFGQNYVYLSVLNSTSNVYYLEDTNFTIDDSISVLSMYLIPENDEPPVEPPVQECPTLEEQIADYSGSWVQFINMVRQNNPALGNSYQNVVDEAIVAGKISVQGDFITFSGNYDELLQLLMTTSNENPHIQAVLEQELQRQFENGVAGGYDDGYSDGKDYGQEVGYKEGQQDGYNKGASDSLVQNFFGNFLQGIVQAIDAIHFYEIIDDNGTPDLKDDVVEFYISPWSILVIFIGLALVLIFLKVFRGG